MKYQSIIPPFRTVLHQKSGLNNCSNRFLWILLFVLFTPGGSLIAVAAGQQDRAEQKIELLIRDFGERLGVTKSVTVSIVPKNSRLVSIEYDPDQAGAFRMSFEQGFLNTLDDGELRAAVAHEMGHVWIFTHFPYLHTEALANQQALKLVSSGDLGRVYEKVREWNGKQGDLGKALGCVDQVDDRLRTKTLAPCADAVAKPLKP
jgi:hypothetical protein